MSATTTVKQLNTIKGNLPSSNVKQLKETCKELGLPSGGLKKHQLVLLLADTISDRLEAKKTPKAPKVKDVSNYKNDVIQFARGAKEFSKSLGAVRSQLIAFNESAKESDKMNPILLDILTRSKKSKPLYKALSKVVRYGKDGKSTGMFYVMQAVRKHAFELQLIK